jgi:hypothetical protein
VTINDDGDEVSLDRRWSFVDYFEFKDKKYIQELDDIFVASFMKLIS